MFSSLLAREIAAMDLDGARKLIEDAFERQNKAFNLELKELAFKPIDRNTWHADKHKIVEITNAVQRKFWRAVEEGDVFGDEKKITEKYGKSLEENYGLRGGPFMQLARAYWTFKTEVDELGDSYPNYGFTTALQGVEIKVRQLFFPMPGPVRAPELMRRNAQIEHLREFAPSIDINRFIIENPILAADKKSGCFGAILIASICLVSTLIFVVA
jgi:hypothetical protein